MEELLHNIAGYKIILGSQSPRRQELLRGLNLNFEVKVMDVEENFPPEMVGVDIPMYLAEKKANS
jgi:septum formation protein